MKYKPVKVGKITCSNDDKTYLNHLALAAVILSDDVDINIIREFYDADESKRRIKELDELKEKGIQTELQKWNKEFVVTSDNRKRGRNISVLDLRTNQEKVYDNMTILCKELNLSYQTTYKKLRLNEGELELDNYILTEITEYKEKEPRNKKRRNIPIKVENKDTNEIKYFKSLRSAAKYTGYTHGTLKGRFDRLKCENLIIDNFVLTKMKDDNLKDVHIEDDEVSANWSIENTVYLCKSRPLVKWADIAKVLNKSMAACQNKYYRLEQECKLDYYRNLDITEMEIGA